MKESRPNAVCWGVQANPTKLPRPPGTATVEENGEQVDVLVDFDVVDESFFWNCPVEEACLDWLCQTPAWNGYHCKNCDIWMRAKQLGEDSVRRAEGVEIAGPSADGGSIFGALRLIEGGEDELQTAEILEVGT